MAKKVKQTYFENKWLVDRRFMKWIEKLSYNTVFGCTFCKKKGIKLSNMCIQSVISHKGSQAHDKAENEKLEIERFFKKHVKCSKTVNENNEENAEHLSLQFQSSNDSTIDLTEESSLKLKTESTSTTYQQTTIDHGVSASEVVKAEIVWTLFTVARGFPNNSAKDIHSTFETMFPDSAIASSFQLGPDKLKHMTNWGIAPYVKEQLRNNIGKAEDVVVSFDESLNHTTQSMDLLLRYWNNHDQQGKVRYLDSKFLTHTTNKDLVVEFNKSVDIINLAKIIQVSMDGPSVNLKFLQELVKHREELEIEEKMIDIGTC